jgi:hypothetical protein
VILRRWVGIREERGQAFSAAVAARQLALWAKDVATQASLSPKGGIPLVSARDACAAVEAARFAADAIRRAQAHKTEFPEDLEAFLRDAEAALRLSQAKLTDAEILLHTQRPGAPACTDKRVSDRLLAGQKDRLNALGRLAREDPARARVLYRLALTSDPSAAVREVAARAVEGTPSTASSSFRRAAGARKVRPGTASSPP